MSERYKIGSREIQKEDLANSSVLPTTGSTARLAAVDKAEPAEHSVKGTNKSVAARHAMKSNKQEYNQGTK